MTSRRRLKETNFGLYFSVGAEGSAVDEALSLRAEQAFDAFESLMDKEGMELLSRPDSTISADFRYLPFELFDFEYESQVEDGLEVYSLWVNSPGLTVAEAQVLRDMAERAFQSVPGGEVKFVRAEKAEIWEEVVTLPFNFEEAAEQPKK